MAPSKWGKSETFSETFSHRFFDILEDFMKNDNIFGVQLTIMFIIVYLNLLSNDFRITQIQIFLVLSHSNK